MNYRINNGLLKAAVYGLDFRRFDAEFQRLKGDETEHLPRHLVKSVLTAFTLQMISLFDDGLTEVWKQRKPNGDVPFLGVKVNEFVKLGYFLDGDAVKALVKRRNELAHESEAFATWEDWDASYRLIQTELRHLGMVH